MSPRDALALLDNVASAYNGPRQDHFNLQMAITVLRGVIDQAEQKAEMTGEALPAGKKEETQKKA